MQTRTFTGRDARLLWIGAGATVLIATSAALAQPQPAASNPPTEVAPGPDPRAEILAKRTALASELAVQRERIDAAAERPDIEAQLEAELEMLERVDRLHQQQLEALRRGEDLERASRASRDRLAAGPRSDVVQAPPYPLVLLDALTDNRESHARRSDTVEAAERAAAEALEQARTQFEARERARRQAREAADSATDEPLVSERAQALRVAELESRLADERRQLAKLELANARSDLELQRDSEALVERALAWVESNLALSRGDLETPLARLERREFELRQALESATRAGAAAERRLEGVQERLDLVAEPPPELTAELEARRIAQRSTQRRAAFITDQLERLVEIRAIWDRRYLALSGEEASRSTLRSWEEELERAIGEGERRHRLEAARHAEIRDDLAAVSERASAAAAANLPEARWLGEQVRQLAELDRVYREQSESLAQDLGFRARTLGEMRRRTDRVTPAERLRSVVEGISEGWDTEVAAVDDRPITVGKLVTALLLFTLGLAFSRLLSRLLARLLHRRTRLDTGAATAFQSLSFYVLLVIFFLFALRTVNIPLTAFTILGGAFAIGIGFGSQNILNNFISGLILLAERPIKVGDIVEIDTTQGRVERIGARSTRVCTFDNTHIIVPNSAFLERNVVNWTLSDDVIRTRVDVGVAYGSPTREVDRLIHRALAEHGQILGDPEPLVLFTAFGDNALEFRAYFWIRVQATTNRLRIESDVRYRIDHLFRDAGISIAFPQRDVHLDADRPIPVRLLQGEDEAP